jgi:hypothetical protein
MSEGAAQRIVSSSGLTMANRKKNPAEGRPGGSGQDVVAALVGFDLPQRSRQVPDRRQRFKSAERATPISLNIGVWRSDGALDPALPS